ncbi:hypothetical protein SADUNF_Sadunf05G0137200 [Salix dunnii]|uniref:STL11/RBM22-like N-terminal domain-containing protein n=1 Tax=Salix dunnii TaxID=1413687 RepID=A0A835K1Y0_9ROSI|nr:hypothetical protein SADUNF_Sadunf05G0137200 [Salix dunnii]
MREYQGNLKRNDPEADGWECADFLIICKTCIGDNPYVRMSSIQLGMQDMQSTAYNFRWKPGRNARFKETEVCQTCYKLRNACEVCFLDVEYGLPVQVRDTTLNLNSNQAVPKSDINIKYFAGVGIGYESSYGKVRPNDTILKLQRMTPDYKGTKCSCMHETPITQELSQQNKELHRAARCEDQRATSKGPLFCPRPNRIHKFGASPGICFCKAEKAGEQHVNRLVIKGLRLKLRRPALDSKIQFSVEDK